MFTYDFSAYISVSLSNRRGSDFSTKKHQQKSKTSLIHDVKYIIIVKYLLSIIVFNLSFPLIKIGLCV